MLAEILKSPLVTMNLRVVDHAALLSTQVAAAIKVMERDRETCHMCGVSIPGFMEIDHVNGHRKCDAKDLRCICQFCHNLRHPLWSGARKRIVPIFAPDMSQEDIHRLAWVVLAWRGEPDNAPVDVTAVVSDMRARQIKLGEMIGSTSSEALFEAILGLADVVEPVMAETTAMCLDQFVRFWPSELTEAFEKLDRGSRLSAWDIGGFSLIADEAAAAIRGQVSPDFEKLRQAALSIKSV